MDVQWTVWVLSMYRSLDPETGRLLGVTEAAGESRSLCLVGLKRHRVVVLTPLEGVESGDQKGTLAEAVSRDTDL